MMFKKNLFQVCLSSYVLVILAAFCTVSCSQETKTESTSSTAQKYSLTDPIIGVGKADISISATNAPVGRAYLVGTYADQLFRIDTAQVSPEGKLRFKKDPAFPQGHYYVTFENNTNFQLILGEDQTMEISVDVKAVGRSFTSDNKENKLLYETMRRESAMQPEFNAARTKLKALQEGTKEYEDARSEQLALNTKRKAMLEEVFANNPKSMFVAFKKSGQNPEVRMGIPEESRIAHYRKDFWTSVDFSDTRLLRTPVINNKLKRYMKELTPQHPDSIVQSATWLIDSALPYPEYFKFFANWVPLNYEPTKTTLMDPEMVYTNVIQRYHTFDRAYWADSTLVIGLQRRASEMAGSLLGLKGPNVTANDINGAPKSIYDIKEDYIIVYLYSPDCEHCKEETPKLIKWYLKSKPFRANVYSIAVKTTDAEWREYAASARIPWTNVYDPTNRAIYAKYFVDITPEMYVLNKDRTIIAKNIKTHQLDEVINRDRGR
ncbi:MAG: thiol-disulfide isomerase/thioredoxin [Saprospiraceae bacterium]|jgi:thiol-disulfide isomerase/thioredoxin